MKKLFNNVAIIGVGLIGGSMALGIKKKGLASRIIGVSRHKSTLIWANKNRVIDKGSQDLRIIQDADLVILATPVNTILNLADLISKFIKEDCVVCDVGSTKAEIVSKLSNIFPNYVGSHPLSGSEKRGIQNASADIFKNSVCILTPTNNTNPMALNKIRRMWRELGARVVLLPPDKHDRILSFVSHLPHIVAFSLIGIIPDEYLRFGSSGLKDATRIALSDSQLWTDIFLSNKKYVMKAIGLLHGNLSQIESAIRKRDRKLLTRTLREAKEKRGILN